jgi:hypothetical protein
LAGTRRKRFLSLAEPIYDRKLEAYHLDLIEGELSGAPGATGAAKSRLTTVTERSPIGASKKLVNPTV